MADTKQKTNHKTVYTAQQIERPRVTGLAVGGRLVRKLNTYLLAAAQLFISTRTLGILRGTGKGGNPRFISGYSQRVLGAQKVARAGQTSGPALTGLKFPITRLPAQVEAAPSFWGLSLLLS